MEDTNAELLSKSLLAVIPRGSSLLPSVLDVVLPSTGTDSEFYKDCEKRLLFLLLKSLRGGWDVEGLHGPKGRMKGLANEGRSHKGGCGVD